MGGQSQSYMTLQKSEPSINAKKELHHIATASWGHTQHSYGTWETHVNEALEKLWQTQQADSAHQ